MTIIGSAYVDIRAITDHLEADIKKALATLPDKIDVRVDADTTAAENQIDLLIAWADLHKVDIAVHADTALAEAAIEAAAHNAEVDINVNADTVAARAHIDALIEEEDARHIDVPVEVDEVGARSAISRIFDSVKNFTENAKPIQLFDAKAIEAQIKEAKRIGDDAFKAPLMYRISTQASEDALNHLKTTGSNVGEFLSKLGGATQLIEFSKAAIMAKINLGEHSIGMAVAAEKAAAMGSAMLSAAGNLLSLGSSAVQLTGLFAALPGVFVGFEIASKITGIAFSDMKKAVPELQKEFQHLKDTIAQDFWSTARKGFEDLFITSHTLGDQLNSTAKSVGGFWGAMTEGMSKGSFAKAMVGDFANLNSGIKIMTGSSETFLHIFQTLGEFGSAYIPKLAQGLVDVSARFDAFLTKANADGTLKRWVDQGVESFHGLMSAIVNTSAVIGGLMKAAVDAGGASLGIFGAAMERLAAVIRTPDVQKNLVNIFSGANAAIDAVVKGLSVFLGAIGYLSPALKVVETDAGKAIQSILQIFGAVLSNPLVFKGIQDLFTGIVNGINAFTTVTGPLGDKLGILFTIVGEVADSLGHVFAHALEVMLPLVKDLLTGIEPLIKPLGDITKAIIDAVAPSIKILVEQAFPPLIDLLQNSVLPALGQLIPVLGKALPPIVEAFSKLIKDAAPIVADLVRDLTPLITAFIHIAEHAIPPVLEVVKKLLDGLVKFYDAAIKPLIGPISDIAAKFFDMKGSVELLAGAVALGLVAWGTFNGLIKGAKLAIELYNIAAGIADGLNAALAFSTAAAGGAADEAAGGFTAMDVALAGLQVVLDALGIGLIILAIVALIAIIILLVANWDKVTKAVGDFTKDAGKNLGDFFGSTGSMITDFNKNTNGMFMDFFKNTGGMFTDFFKSTISMLTDFNSNTNGMFMDFFNSTGGMFTDFFNNTVGMIVDWGTRSIGMFVDFFNNTVGMVSDWGTRTVGMFVDFFNNTVGMFTDFFNKVMEGFRGFAHDPIGEVHKLVDGVVSTVNKFRDDVMLNFAKFFLDVFNGFVKWRSDIVNSVTAWAMDIAIAITKFGTNTFGMFGDFFKNTIGMFSDFFKNTDGMFTDFWNGVPKAIEKFRDNSLGMLHDFVNNTRGMFTDFFNGAVGMFNDGFNNIRSTVVSWAINTIGMFNDFNKNTRGMFNDFFAGIGGMWTDFWNNLPKILMQWVINTTGMINDFDQNTNGMFNDFFAGIGGMWNDFVNGIIATVQGWVDGLSGMFIDYYNQTTGETRAFLDGFISSVGGWVNQTIGMFSDFFSNTVGMFNDMWNNVHTAVDNGIRGLGEWFGGIGQTIQNAIGDPGTILQRAGQSIMDGFLGGLNAGFKGVQDMVGGVADWIAQHKGPEEYDRALLIPHGGWIMGGLQKGIENSMGGLKNTLTGVTDLISDTMNTGVAVNVTGNLGRSSSNPNIFSNAAAGPHDPFAAVPTTAGMSAAQARTVITPTVNVYPSAPLNEAQVGQMAATELYWNFMNR